jgi:hypothetical protein
MFAVFEGTTRRLAFLPRGLLIALMLGACGGAVPADVLAALPAHVELTDSGTQMSFSGQIQAMGIDSWTVEGVSFNVNGRTEIKGDFVVGDQVKVHLTLDSASGALLATVIEGVGEPQIEPTERSEAGDILLEPTEEASSTPEADATPGTEDYEFIGIVNAMGGGAWTINDNTVTIMDQTEIKDAITVGDTVKVEARVSLDGTITAKEIKLALSEDLSPSGDNHGEAQDGMEVKLHGTIEAYSPASITVNGKAIALLPSTEINGVLVVGADVEVEASLNADGTLNTKSIEVESNSAIVTSTQTGSENEIDDNSETEDHHDGTGGGGSVSNSGDSHDGGGSHSDD